MNREHVLQHELRRILMLPVGVALDVEADHVPSFGQEPFGPATEPAIEVYAKGFHRGISLTPTLRAGPA